jgi:hypothetical protein
MVIRNAEVGYNTNLASEYLMMSLLFRAGKDAYLSLGNKKGVDIIVKTNQGSICVIEVKGNNKRNDWLIGSNGTFPNKPNLLFALVLFNGKINDINSPADFWLIPSEILAQDSEHKIASNNKTVFISFKRIQANYKEYQNTFIKLDEYLNSH